MSKPKYDMGLAADELVGFRIHGVNCSDYDSLSSTLLSWHPALVETFKNTYRKSPYLILNLLTDSSGRRESYPSWIPSAVREKMAPIGGDPRAVLDRPILSCERTACG